MKTIGKVFLWLIGIFALFEIGGIVVAYYSRHIRPETVLSLEIAGDIPDQAPQQPLLKLVAGPAVTVTDLVEGLDRARTDPRINGVDLRVSESTMNMAKIQEIREKILELNRAGKFSVAQLEFATNRSYYLASACQTVFLLPKSVLLVRGMMASTTFLRGALDKLGIYPDLYHIGEYKNASNVFTEKKYTQAHREATEALLEDWYSEFLRGVAEARRLKPEDVKTTVEKGPLASQEALAARLVDQLGYADQEREFVNQKNHGSTNRLRVREYLRRTERQSRLKLAVIYAAGLIAPGRSGNDPLGESVMGSDTIAEQFSRARDDASIKAVVLRVDSPGGAAFSSEVIRRELEITKRLKPVVVSMSDVAASGGYWISMSANKIVAEPGTITGSIGVIAGKFNLRGLFDKLGLSTDYVATTENATLEWPMQSFTPAQRESLLRLMRDDYDSFVRRVAEDRHLKIEAVERIARGRVWTGKRARQLGLIDEIGGLHTAIAEAKTLARIPQGKKVSLIFLPPPKSLFERIIDLLGSARVPSPAASVKDWLARIESLARQPVWAVLTPVPQAQ